MIDRHEKFTLLDVREPQEFESNRIPGSVLIPLGQLKSRLTELDPSQYTVVQCHSGKRSAAACEILKENGFENVINLKGGILAWMDA